MKKIVLCFVVFLLFLGLVSCASDPAQEEKKGSDTDLLSLSAQDLYAYAEEKTLSQGAVEWNTKLILPDGEEKEIRSVRIKDGYDGFAYSRTGFEEDIWFLSSTAYVRSPLGSYSSPMSGRVFLEYLQEAFFPTGLVSDLTESWEKTEKGVSYTLNKEKLSLFTLSLSQGDFIPEKVSGEAQIDDKGIVLKEAITVKGTLSGAEATYRLETETNLSPDEKIVLPQSETFATVGDIRIPSRITEGVAGLTQKADQEISLLVSGSLSGENALSYYEETVLTVAKNREYYLRGQDLKKQAGKEDQATYFQALLKGDIALENRYDLMKKELISEGALSQKDYDLSSLLSSKLPSLSGLGTVELIEDLRQDTVIFSLTAEAVNGICSEFSALFPDAAVPTALAEAEATGVYTFSKEGEVVAFSLALSATANGKTFSYQVSLTPRSVLDPSLPDALSLPEYIDPSHGGFDR